MGKDQWWAAWREAVVSNHQLVDDLRCLYHPCPALRVVWIEGIKGELAEEAAAHETSLLKRLNKSVAEVIELESVMIQMRGGRAAGGGCWCRQLCGCAS